MPFHVSEKSKGSSFSKHPAGVFAARCTRIIDLGTQETTFKGEKKQSHKFSIAWETEHPVESGEFAGKPSMVMTRYTASLNEKAVLRKDLESWRGRKFTPAELERFDLKNIMGKGCLLNIVHDGDYANVSAVMPLPPSMKAPPQGEMIFFSLEEFDSAVYEKLSDYFKGLISVSPEYKAIMEGSAPTTDDEPNGTSGYDDSDIPF